MLPYWYGCLTQGQATPGATQSHTSPCWANSPLCLYLYDIIWGYLRRPYGRAVRWDGVHKLLTPHYGSAFFLLIILSMDSCLGQESHYLEQIKGWSSCTYYPTGRQKSPLSKNVNNNSSVLYYLTEEPMSTG